MIEKLFENYSYGHRDYLNGGMSFGYRFFLIDSLIDVQVEKKLGNEVVQRLTWRQEMAGKFENFISVDGL